MSSKIYDIVLKKIASEVPLFAEQILNKALKELETTPDKVSSFELKMAIEQHIEPVLNKKLGVKKTLRELGSGLIVVNKKGEKIFVSKNAKKLVPDFNKRTFNFSKNISTEFLKFNNTSVKIIIIPLINEKKELNGSVFLILDNTFDVEMEKEMSLAHSKLIESEKKFHDIALVSGDLIWEINSKMKYVFVSGRVKQLLGFEPSEIIGKTPFDLMTSKDAKKILPIFKKITKTKKPFTGLENWNISKEGQKVCFMSSGVPLLDKKGKLLGYRGINRDITKDKKVQHDLIEKNKELESFNRIAVGRELRMIELKNQIRQLKTRVNSKN